MYVLLWLLLPVAAATGWWCARRVSGQGRASGSTLPPEYFRGLNYLLSEQPDKAVELFARLPENDPESVDLQLTVGGLFRRRGEVERAIRIHQQLLVREGLTESQRKAALLELGDDYFRAGLLDRAEQLLTELTALEPANQRALALLQQIYQQEKDWVRALAVAGSLEAADRNRVGPVIAHYHCELAEAALVRRDFPIVRNHVESALKADSQCVRASLVEGKLQFEEGDFEGALACYERLLRQDPAYLGEVIVPIADCFFKQHKTEHIADYLLALLRRYPSGHAALTVAQVLKQQQSESDAGVFLAHFLNKTPSLAGLLALVDLNLSMPGVEARDTFRVAKSVLEKVLDQEPAYRCRLCGFSGKSLHWQCPGCKSWNSVRPTETISEVSQV